MFSAYGWALLISLALAVGLWGPYLYREITKGKVSLGPRVPDGTGDIHPGRRDNPAPGQPDAQADPYETKATR